MKTKFVPYTAQGFSAETPFNVRCKGGEPFAVSFNQFGQLLTAAGRLVDPLPDEMEVPDPAATPAPAKP